MKRDRPSTPGLDPPEVLNFDGRRKIADRGERAEFCEEDFEWPSSPLEARFVDPPTPSRLPFGPGIQKRSSSPATIKTTKTGILMREEDLSIQMEVCRTPEDMMSPKLHSPPPRPHKTSSPGLSSPKLVHPQPHTKNVALGELIGKIELKPSVLRRIASSTSAKQPKRPRPQLNRNQTMSDIPRNSEKPKEHATFRLTDPRKVQGKAEERPGIRADEVRLNHPLCELPGDRVAITSATHSSHPCISEISSFEATHPDLAPQSTGEVASASSSRIDQDHTLAGSTPPIFSPLRAHKVPRSPVDPGTTHRAPLRAKASHKKQNAEEGRSIQIDPSVGTGLFHHATVSRLRSQPGSEAPTSGQDDWVDQAVRYNPYEMFNSRATPASAKKPSPTPSSAHNNTIIAVPSISITSSDAFPASPIVSAPHIPRIDQTIGTRQNNTRNVNTSLDGSYDLPFEVDSDEDSTYEDYDLHRQPTFSKHAPNGVENRQNMMIGMEAQRMDHDALFLFEMETELMEKQLESFKVLAEAQEGELQMLAESSSSLASSLQTMGWSTWKS